MFNLHFSDTIWFLSNEINQLLWLQPCFTWGVWWHKNKYKDCENTHEELIWKVTQFRPDGYWAACTDVSCQNNRKAKQDCRVTKAEIYFKLLTEETIHY